MHSANLGTSIIFNEVLPSNYLPIVLNPFILVQLDLPIHFSRRRPPAMFCRSESGGAGELLLLHDVHPYHHWWLDNVITQAFLLSTPLSKHLFNILPTDCQKTNQNNPNQSNTNENRIQQNNLIFLDMFMGIYATSSYFLFCDSVGRFEIKAFTLGEFYTASISFWYKL
jgi:hypothetical protein